MEKRNTNTTLMGKPLGKWLLRIKWGIMLRQNLQKQVVRIAGGVNWLGTMSNGRHRYQ
jgi:hypothetical protein